jgi:superfamily II DNA or RNA helicase/phage anti-repressor protein
MESLLQQGTNYEIYVRDIIKEKYNNSWLWKDIPSEILLELEFIKDIKNKCDDIGCDILCKKTNGEYEYIQCKNYSTLGVDNTITIGDLSGFYNFVAENSINNPIVYYSGVLSSQILCRKKKIQYINLPYIKIGNKDIKPRDYQIEAYNKLQTEHRSILEMPCGTGKTLITYLISLNYKNIILLSPLISTTEQLITHYKNYYSTCKEPINYTVINSQNTRDINTIELSQNKNIIGSTFHSCDVINKLLEKLEGSTIIIIDECHNLSHANITDANNEINKLLVGNSKILFISATPKNYENNYNSIFGTIKYKLDWKYAIDNKYICDYNFYYPNNDKIIEYITNIKFDTSIIEKTILINKAFFLLESIKTIHIKKCIVYLKSIKEADLFENILKTINIYFEFTLGIYNINYNTTKTKRNLSLTKFRNNKTKISIMLNVHILDEGIDISECDSVYLTHPNNNPVNIIQRISRANRLSNDKNKAHILLWTKTQMNLENIINQIKSYIPVNFSNINSNFINNRIEESNEIQINNNIHNQSIQTSNNESLIMYLKNKSGINEKFIDVIYKFYNENTTNFVINLDNISFWLEIRKDNIKRLLNFNFVINQDYIEIKPDVKLAGRGKNNIKIIMLTYTCAKLLFMLSKSEKSNIIKNYYIKLDKLIIKYKDTIINNLSNNL